MSWHPKASNSLTPLHPIHHQVITNTLESSLELLKWLPVQRNFTLQPILFHLKTFKKWNGFHQVQKVNGVSIYVSKILEKRRNLENMKISSPPKSRRNSAGNFFVGSIFYFSKEKTCAQLARPLFEAHSQGIQKSLAITIHEIGAACHRGRNWASCCAGSGSNLSVPRLKRTVKAAEGSKIDRAYLVQKKALL